MRNFIRTSAVSLLTLTLGVNAAAFAASTPARQHVSASLRAAAASGTFTVLHNFSGTDGSSPQGNLDLGLQFSGNSLTRTLFGETEGGGSNAGSGTIYIYAIGSNAFNSLYTFSGGTDGSIPLAGLANNETNYFLSGQTQLGVTIAGGANQQGTVFAIGPNGVPTVIHAFTGGADGSSPAGRLTLFTDGNYYGTTSGGALGYGTVYRVSRSGVFSTIYTFTGGRDGGSPVAGVSLRVDLGGRANVAGQGIANATLEHTVMNSPRYVSAYLYGTTSTGAADNSGTIFRITPAGKLQTIHTFTGGADGGAPEAKLTSDLYGNLFGSTSVGGSAGNGVIFAIPRNTTSERVIHDFGNGAGGATPVAQLTIGFNGVLYGTASQGGASGQFGTVFALAPSNGAFADIHDFASTDGSDPEGALVDGGDGNLYGTAIGGGTASGGVLFSIAE